MSEDNQTKHDQRCELNEEEVFLRRFLLVVQIICALSLAYTYALIFTLKHSGISEHLWGRLLLLPLVFILMGLAIVNGACSYY